MKTCTHLRSLSHTVKTMRGLKIVCDQIEHIEINYDAHTNVVRLRTVCQYDTFLMGY